jgi:heme/copper-type cytochrome/quinol oxidase subunit 3
MSANPSIAPIPVEPPDIEARVITAGSYLAAAATAFFFVAFLFAFLYLRALDNNGLWGGGKPHHHVHPALTAGIAILVCVLASVGLIRFAVAAVRGGGRSSWLAGGWVALGLGVVSIGVQCWQYTALGFGPGDGGYASVYLAWTGFFAIFTLGAMLWLEALLASAQRGVAAARGNLAADLAAFSLVWTMLGIVETVAFVLLFIVQ